MSGSRPQRSTVIVAAVFVVTGVLYLIVRPEDRPARVDSPIPVYVVSTTTIPESPPATTAVSETTAVTETTVAPETSPVEPPPTQVPATSTDQVATTGG